MSLISQEIRNSKKVDLYKKYGAEIKIWEENKNYGLGALIFGLVLSFCGILLAPIGLFIFLPFGILFLYYPKKYVIKFTTSELMVRKRLLGKTRKFQLYDLYKIDIIITKRKIYYHSDSGTYNAILKVKLKILTSMKEYKYNFTWIFHQKRKSIFGGYKEAKEQAIKKRECFEVRLQELEQVFPSLINFTDKYPMETQLKHEKKMRRIMYSTFFLLTLSTLLISNEKNERAFSFISLIEFLLLFYLIITDKFNKTKEMSPKQNTKSIKNITISIFNGFLLFFFAYIFVGIIGYVLLFLLETLISLF